jgi:hypothetical protein
VAQARVENQGALASDAGYELEKWTSGPQIGKAILPNQRLLETADTDQWSI